MLGRMTGCKRTQSTREPDLFRREKFKPRRRRNDQGEGGQESLQAEGTAWVVECGGQGMRVLNGAGWGWITHSSEPVSYLLHPAPCSHDGLYQQAPLPPCWSLGGTSRSWVEWNGEEKGIEACIPLGPFLLG